MLLVQWGTEPMHTCLYRPMQLQCGARSMLITYRALPACAHVTGLEPSLLQRSCRKGMWWSAWKVWASPRMGSKAEMQQQVVLVGSLLLPPSYHPHQGWEQLGQEAPAGTPCLPWWPRAWC
jgi:hypothetical protein